MDGKQPSPPRTRRKVKYAPRSTPSRKPKPTATPKTEAGDEEDDRESAQAQAIFRRMSESIARRGSKAETKLKNSASVQVAFGPGASSSPSLQTYGNNKGVKSGKGSSLASKVSGSEENVLSLPSTGLEDQSDALMIDATHAATDAPAGKVKKEYEEPWDYESTYYPTSLPLRKPNSGSPEILDEEEFGEVAASIEYYENSVNFAAQLEQSQASSHT